MAALAYLWITGVVFLLLPRFRRNPYVRFHSAQAVFGGLVVLVVNVVMAQISLRVNRVGIAIMIYMMVWGLVRLTFLLLWMLAVAKAYQGFEYELPWVGGMARKYASEPLA